MHKHSSRRRQRGQRKSGRFNANLRLSESAQTRIRNLFGEIDSEGNFALDYLRSEYTSKFCEVDSASADLRRSAAIEKWLTVETKNANTNMRLSSIDDGWNILPRVTIKTFLGFARNLVKDILGPLRDEVVLGSFSGGASTSRKRTESHAAQKFVGQADVTQEAADFVQLILNLSPLLRQYETFSDLKIVEGAVLFTVPKKTEIDRCACKEPDVNMFLQKGVGKHIRQRLLKFGIHLNDQSVNRRLAHLGSLDGSLATLDLSSASDTVTIECVRALLPEDWFEYLNYIRSQSVLVDGKLIRTEMFSSMGNGFTFELESLIFFVLMRSVAYFEGISGIISIYGDDIIIPSGLYDMATWVLQEFGFSCNPDKSFSAGPFRESCGGHYYSGEDVTPFYLKKPPSRLTDLIRVANQLRRWALAEDGRQYEFPWLYDLWSDLRDRIPSNLWGGRDLDLDTQLVSPHPARFRLVRITKDKELPMLGSYLHWHVSNRNRTSDSVTTVGFSESLETTTYCRSRRAKPGAPYLDRIFFQELQS